MTDVLKLYTFKLCPFAHRMRLALAEKGLPAEMVEIDLRNKPEWFNALSPEERVPLLLHGDVRIWESAVILEYLDEAFPDPPLLPAAPAERARARLWIDFANKRLFAATHGLVFERDGAQRRLLVEQLERDIRFLESETMRRRDRRGAFLLGERFTLADIALFPWFEQSATLEKFSEFRMPGDCDGVREWSAAVAARPAVVQCSRPDAWYVDAYRAYLAHRRPHRRNLPGSTDARRACPPTSSYRQ